MQAIVEDLDLQHRYERAWTGLYLDTRCDNAFAPVREHEDVTGLEVWRGVLDEVEILAGRVVYAVKRHSGSVSARERGFKRDRSDRHLTRPGTSKVSGYTRTAITNAGIERPIRPWHDLRHPAVYVQARAGRAEASMAERYVHAAQVAFPVQPNVLRTGYSEACRPSVHG